MKSPCSRIKAIKWIKTRCENAREFQFSDLEDIINDRLQEYPTEALMGNKLIVYKFLFYLVHNDATGLAEPIEYDEMIPSSQNRWMNVAFECAGSDLSGWSLESMQYFYDDVVEIVDAYTDYFYDAFPRCEKLSQIERLVNDMKNKIENDEADRKAGRPTDDEIAGAYSWGF